MTLDETTDNWLHGYKLRKTRPRVTYSDATRKLLQIAIWKGLLYVNKKIPHQWEILKELYQELKRQNLTDLPMAGLKATITTLT